MKDSPWVLSPWVLVDTEATGSGASPFVIDVGAQRMRGWVPGGGDARRGAPLLTAASLARAQRWAREWEPKTES